MRAEIKPIHTEADYKATLAQLEGLLDAREGTREAARAEVLAVLIEAYETEHYPVLPADPVDVIEFYSAPAAHSQRLGTFPLKS